MNDAARRTIARIERALAQRRAPQIMVVPQDAASATELGAAAQANGWRIADRPEHADLFVSFESATDPRCLALAGRSVAVVEAGTEMQWIEASALDAADEVLVTSEASRRRLEAAWARDLATRSDDPIETVRGMIENQADRPRTVGIATCAPDWQVSASWGDTYFARALVRGFRRAGWRARELVRADWYVPAARRCDVVIHLRGLAERRPHPAQTNVLWVISHPERVTPEECDGYDIVAVASEPHADRLAARLGRAVEFVPQGADTDTFRLRTREAALTDEIVYVGSARWPRRPAPRWLLRNGERFRLTGAGWHGLPEEPMLAESFRANRELDRLYRSALVVVADHHGSMRVGGFVANRVFDVLAAGGCVLSDDVDGLTALLGDAVLVYEEPGHLAQHIRRLRDDRSWRDQLVTAGRRTVLDAHTLDHRVKRLISLLDGDRSGPAEDAA